MLYWLAEQWNPQGDPYFYRSALFRAVLAILVGFFIVWRLAPRYIRLLLKLKVGDRPEFHNQTLNQLMKDKSNTPTMGGALIVTSIIASALLLARLDNFYVVMGVFCLVWLMLLGGVDDWLKLTAARRGGSRDGLKMWEKLVFQVALGALLAIFVYKTGEAQLESDRWRDIEATYAPFYNVLQVPFYKQGFVLPVWLFALIAILVIAGTSNAVNLTDGMDGLANGCMVLTALAFMILAFVVGTAEYATPLLFYHIRGAEELAVLCGAVVGACMGFLWYNAYPAQVFMGDTGSLPLGGLMGYVAIVTRLELMLFIVGGVFVIEAVSVLLQIGYYRYTGGKRLFRCAPIHHHFHMGGWTETQTVMRFWLLAALFTTFALATIKLR